MVVDEGFWYEDEGEKGLKNILPVRKNSGNAHMQLGKGEVVVENLEKEMLGNWRGVIE